MLSVLVLLSQAVRDKMRGLRAGHPADAGGAPSAVARLPPAVLRVCRLRKDAQYGGRVLSNGGREVGVQTRL